MYTDLYCHKMLLKNEKVPVIFTVLRKILGIVFLLVSVAAMIIAVRATKKFFAILLTIVFFTAAVPVIIMDGAYLVLWQKHIVSIRAKHGLPIKYDKRKLFGGYAKIFSFLWFFPAASFLIPGGHLWIAVLPPLLLTSVLTLVLIQHTWTAFGFSRRSYWLMHTLALAALSAAAIAFRACMGY